MFLTRRIRIRSAWLAICSLLLSLLAPAVGHAFGGPERIQWPEVCTVVGVRYVALTGGQAADEPAGGSPAALLATAASDGQAHPSGEGHGWGLLEHCPYCAPGAFAFGLEPPRAAGIRTPSAPDAVWPPHPVTLVHSLQSSICAPSRAPPSVA